MLQGRISWSRSRVHGEVSRQTRQDQTCSRGLDRRVPRLEFCEKRGAEWVYGIMDCQTQATVCSLNKSQKRSCAAWKANSRPDGSKKKETIKTGMLITLVPLFRGLPGLSPEDSSEFILLFGVFASRVPVTV